LQEWCGFWGEGTIKNENWDLHVYPQTADKNHAAFSSEGQWFILRCGMPRTRTRSNNGQFGHGETCTQSGRFLQLGAVNVLAGFRLRPRVSFFGIEKQMRRHDCERILGRSENVQQRGSDNP